jgi:hypothetical protein
MTTKKVELLDFYETEEKGERNFTRYEAEFIPREELDIEYSVGEGLKQAWEGVATVAVEGYKKSGRGYVAVIPASVNNRTRFTGELEFDSCLLKAEVFYIAPGDERDFCHHYYLENYDPNTEIAFVIDFSDGMVQGVASFGEVLKKEQARRRRKERAEDKRVMEWATTFQATRQHVIETRERRA